MVRGVGTDLVEIARIQAAWDRHGMRFAQRIMRETELCLFRQRAQDIRFLAKTFALKEAVVKALGTGIARGVGWHSVETGRDTAGRPTAILHDRARMTAEMLGATQVHVSVADERDYVLAFAVLD